MAVLMAIRWSQASAGASPRHDDQFRYAFTNASWTQSSAAARSPSTPTRVPRTRLYEAWYSRSKSACEPGRYPLSLDCERMFVYPPPCAMASLLPPFDTDRLQGDITLDHLIPATAPVYAPLPHDLHPELIAALRSRGIDQLYSHQEEA